MENTLKETEWLTINKVLLEMYDITDIDQFTEKEKIAKAKQYKHMTFYEAAEVAKKAEVAEMWLTHFSPSLVHAEDYMPQVREIFPNAFLGKDGKSVELMFEDEKN